MYIKGLTDIQYFYHNSTVLLTHGNSFLGKLLLEKLLRCTTVKRIYIIIEYSRKNSKDVKQKLTDYLNEGVFSHLNTSRIKLEAKVVIFDGNYMLPDLGLTEEHKNIISKEVDVIICCDTTMNLDQTLNSALKVNVQIIRYLLKIARNMSQLRAIIYISTAYCNIPDPKMDEKFYDCKFKARDLVNLIDIVDESFINEMQTMILKECPNNYIFSKKMAEDFLNTEGKGLPIGIIRPGMVFATEKEPLMGYIDNCYGPTGIWLSSALGYARTINLKQDAILELTPADYLVNLTLASALTMFRCSKSKGSQNFKIEIFNLLPHKTNQITYQEYQKICLGAFIKQPSVQLVWYPFNIIVLSRPLYYILDFSLNIVPVYTYDFIANIFGKKNCRFMKIYKLHQRFNRLFGPFLLQNLKKNDYMLGNVKAICCKMSDCDRKLFYFDMETINWQSYLTNYVKGMRMHLLKEDESTVPEGLKKLHERKMYNIFILCVLTIILSYFMYYILNFF